MNTLRSRVLTALVVLVLASTPLFAGGRAIRKKVDPAYPTVAKQMQLRGTVRLQVIIAPDGTVKDTDVLGGNPVLAKAAVEAVQQWRFQPGPEETKDVIEVTFTLQ